MKNSDITITHTQTDAKDELMKRKYCLSSCDENGFPFVT